MVQEALTTSQRQKYLAVVLVILVFFAYFYANPQSGSFYDYTFRIADALLHGKLGLEEQPPQWLNEMIPHNGKYYSAFPLGGVLTMIPLAILKELRLVQSFPGVLIAALLASIITLLLFLLSARYNDSLPQRVVLTLFPVLGTWMWANLAFAGAWHIALGFAVAGQLAALYFILIRFNPFLAGLSFAIAFGNRTEILLLAPIFFYLLYRTCANDPARLSFSKAIDRFVAIPIALGVATLLYNYARFHSLLDFGYARIPGVLEEPWYQHGIFSIHAIPGNAYAMLLETWQRIPKFPHLVPTGFGGSIFLSCPFLVFLFRPFTKNAMLKLIALCAIGILTLVLLLYGNPLGVIGILALILWVYGSPISARDATLKLLAWCAVGILTLVLWLHGNPGGWQISYRYATELLPWLFLILLESSPKKVTPMELTLFLASVAINAYSTWLFLYTSYMNSNYQQPQ